MNEKQVIERAMKDMAFRKRLLADPATTLKSAGAHVPAGASIRVVEDTATVMHLVLPAVDAEGTVSDNDLESVAGGRCLDTNALHLR